MLKPSEQHGKSNRPRPLSEAERRRQRQQKEKADFYARNPHRKWGDR